LFKMPATKPVCVGLIERIGMTGSVITHKIYTGEKEEVIERKLDIPGHEEGMMEAAKLLTEKGISVIANPDEIEVVGHRIVHGGEKMTRPVIIDDGPGSYQGIVVAEKLFSKAKQVAVFDTAFHQTLPQKAFRYAIPQKFYSDDGIRVYGFHGISHKYVSGKALEYLGKPDAKVITIHLGNGCSMAAINAGTCIDTSMGLTPLDGLIMGTRSGAIDPSVVMYLMSQLKYSVDEVNELLNKKSGMSGLTGYSDMRDIRKLYDNGDANAKLAFDMFAYRIQKYIGAYAAALNGLDAIVFTAGIGENDSMMRERICSDLDYLGIRIDKEKNSLKVEGIRDIGATSSKVKVLVIPTNEELEIADQCFSLLNDG
jgi:acetate kinase